MFSFCTVVAQSLTLKKGVIMDSIPIANTSSESFSLFLPTNFDAAENWPIVFVFDVNGKSKQALSMFKGSAEKLGYILAASNNVHDTISIANNVLVANRMQNAIYSILPIHENRVYTAGFGNGARLASTMPILISGIEGVISAGANIRSVELLGTKETFYFIGIIGKEDFNYAEMLALKKELNRRKIPNELLKFNGGHEWPTVTILEQALQLFTLSAMAKGNIVKDDAYINRSYDVGYKESERLYNSGKFLRANDHLEELINVYRTFKEVDSLKDKKRALKKMKEFKAMNRNETASLFKESLIKQDYGYYLEEDILSYNYNNLGWWNYQIGELEKYKNSKIVSVQQMGVRLNSYINALVEDNIDIQKGAESLDEEALRLLWMIKTITDANDFDSYLKIISSSAKIEDYGTALFYLEEALKKGYRNRDELYALEHTVLLRITPEFNKLVAKYLKEARYNILEE